MPSLIFPTAASEDGSVGAVELDTVAKRMPSLIFPTAASEDGSVGAVELDTVAKRMPSLIFPTAASEDGSVGAVELDTVAKRMPSLIFPTAASEDGSVGAVELDTVAKRMPSLVFQTAASEDGSVGAVEFDTEAKRMPSFMFPTPGTEDVVYEVHAPDRLWRILDGRWQISPIVPESGRPRSAGNVMVMENPTFLAEPMSGTVMGGWCIHTLPYVVNPGAAVDVQDISSTERSQPIRTDTSSKTTAESQIGQWGCP
eukprot:gene19381-26030_t